MPTTNTDAEIVRQRAIRAGAIHLSRLDAAGRTQQTAAARAEMQRRLELQVDPHGELDPTELAIRVKHLRRAWMAELSLAGVAARRAKATERQHADEAAELDALIDAETSLHTA